MKNVEADSKINEEKVVISASEYADLLSNKEENDELKKKLDWFMEQFTLSKKKMFGTSSEKSEYLQVDIFNETEFFSSDEEEPATTEIKGYTRKKKTSELSSRLPDDLPVEIIRCTLPEEDMTCNICGHDRHEIGSTLARRELEFIPASAKVKEYWQSSYGCRNCENSGTQVDVIKAEVPRAVIKGSFASPEAIAHIATQKFVMGSPLYRQEQELHRKGIGLSRQTMSNWLVKATESHLYKLYDRLQEDLMKNDILHADETELQVLKEPGKSAQSKSFMWLYRTGSENDYPIVLYEYQPDRKHKRPREFLDGFSGYLQTDGYGAYRNLPDEISVVCCFAHARRKFTDALTALKDHPPDDKKKTIAGKGKEYCDALFKIEHDIEELDAAGKKLKRQELALPILDEMRVWLDSVRAPGESKTGKALTYLKNQWDYLIRYTADGRLELSNNRAERSIKPFVIGRKNFLFANTPKGAKTSAVLYSIIETAKENGLDPFLYLTYIFTKSKDMYGDDPVTLMPYDPLVQKNCKSQVTPNKDN